MRIYDDTPSYRDVCVTFTDGTEVTVHLGVKTVATATHYRRNVGDFDTIQDSC